MASESPERGGDGDDQIICVIMESLPPRMYLSAMLFFGCVSVSVLLYVCPVDGFLAMAWFCASKTNVFVAKAAIIAAMHTINQPYNTHYTYAMAHTNNHAIKKCIHHHCRRVFALVIM